MYNNNYHYYAIATKVKINNKQKSINANAVEITNCGGQLGGLTASGARVTKRVVVVCEGRAV